MVEILDTSCEIWDIYLDSMPTELKDIYYKREYYRLQEVNGEGKGKLFVYKEGNKLCLYPFLINEIKGYNLDQVYYDIETAYGYGGPLSNTDDEEFIKKFEENFMKYCIDNSIVAEFVRFHPLIKNQNIFKQGMKVLHNRTTVYIDLTKPLEEIWKNDITSKNRNVIRKAEKNHLTVEFNEDLEVFKEIYENTMKKVNAGDYYYFSNDYYSQLDKLDNIYISVKYEDEVIASAIFMKCEGYFHYHLAGSIKEYLKYSPNNLLLWTAIKYAKDNGFKKMHFGGGLSDSLEDNLFKFKKSFSKDTSDFYIGKRIHNDEIYNELISRWEESNNKKASLFLQYRY